MLDVFMQIQISTNTINAFVLDIYGTVWWRRGPAPGLSAEYDFFLCSLESLCVCVCVCVVRWFFNLKQRENKNAEF